MCLHFTMPDNDVTANLPVTDIGSQSTGNNLQVPPDLTRSRSTTNEKLTNISSPSKAPLHMSSASSMPALNDHNAQVLLRQNKTVCPPDRPKNAFPPNVRGGSDKGLGSVPSMETLYNEHSDNEVMEEDLSDTDTDDEWEGLETTAV